MTDLELAQIERWQHTDGGRAELAIHTLAMSLSDLAQAACTREGFTTARKSRAALVECRNTLDWLIANTTSMAAQ